ncbi:MAG: HPr(Ser) kinase/phosphatase [Bacilli bacterium]|jgi:HPr kinase/phosphorylase|nr:HPr(Ser) kinase/phosphatase [Bacilli bacterium]
MNYCTIGDLADNFSLKPFFTSPKALKRPIKVIEVDRPGLEMAGFFEYHQKSRLVLVGRKEAAFLAHMSEMEAYQAFLTICSDETPGIIICHGVDCPPVILKAAKEKDCCVFATEVETSAFEADALSFLAESLAPRTSIHANLLEIFGAGCLLIGDSGIGKSEVSLDLIKRGHILVADDKVDILNVRNRLEGSSPALTYGMMEVRGIGIIDVPRMFGINAIKRKAHIRYCIDLKPFNPAESIDRIGNSGDTIEYLGIKIPYIKLPVSPGRSMAEVIEVAVTNYKLKDYGFDSAAEFEKRMDESRKVAELNLESEEK